MRSASIRAHRRERSTAASAFEELEPLEPVDAVVASTSLHHVGDPEEVLDRVASALERRGTVVVVEWAWEDFDEQSARWCFDRLAPGDAEGWIHRRRDGWLAAVVRGTTISPRLGARARAASGHVVAQGARRAFPARSLRSRPVLLPEPLGDDRGRRTRGDRRGTDSGRPRGLRRTTALTRAGFHLAAAREKIVAAADAEGGFDEKAVEYGGYAAALILIVFGVAALVLGLVGRSEVQDNLAREKIEGTPDMTPEGIKEGAQAAGLETTDLPTCSVAGELVDTGMEAKCFGDYMRIHALEATGGKVYAEMGRYLTADGEDTNDPAEAAKQEDGTPTPNGARDIWVTETSLATALYMAFFAESVSIFSIVVAIALIIAGIGFGVLAYAAFRWLPQQEARAANGT